MFLFKKKKPREQIENPYKDWQELPPEIRAKTPKPKQDKYIAKYAKDEEGKSRMTHIIGEKYPIRGLPTGDGLGRLEMIKNLFDRIIQSRLASFIVHEIPHDELSKPVRVLAEEIDNLIDAEKLKGRKKRWKNYKKVLCHFFEQDLPYRYTMQWLLERLAKRIDEIKLDDGDKYHFRVKNFRVDLDEDWKALTKKFPELKRQDIAKEFKKILYDEKHSDTCYGDNSKPEDLAQKFFERSK